MTSTAPEPASEPGAGTLIPGFEHDVFISYAHADDKPIFLGDKTPGWVAQLSYALKARLTALMGKIDVFDDSELKRSEEFADRLEEVLSRVAVLVPVVTASYMNSAWCRRELDAFLDQAKKTGDVDNRIFPVYKERLKKEDRPPELQGKLGFKFFRESGKYHVPITPTTEDEKIAFFEQVAEMAGELQAYLDAFQPAPPRPEESESTDAQPRPTPKTRKVYLSQTLPGLITTRDQVRRELQANGYQILPDAGAELPEDENAFESRILSYLQECELIVHLIPAQANVSPDDSGVDRVNRQNRVISAYAKNPEVLENTTIEALKTRIIKDYLEKPPTAGAVDHPKRIMWIEPGFKTGTGQTGEQQVPPTPDPEPVPQPITEPVGPLSVYLICTREDLSVVMGIGKILSGSNGWDVRIPVFGREHEGDEAAQNTDQTDVMKHHRQQMNYCDLFLVYYGHASDAWAQSNITDIRKLKGHRTKKVQNITVYLAEPEASAPEKQALKFAHGLTVVETDAELEALVAQLNASRAQDG